MIYDRLVSLPGESWQDRWSLFNAETAERPWREVGWPGHETGEDVRLAAGLASLLILDVIRPSYASQHGRGLRCMPATAAHNIPA